MDCNNRGKCFSAQTLSLFCFPTALHTCLAPPANETLCNLLPEVLVALQRFNTLPFMNKSIHIHIAAKTAHALAVFSVFFLVCLGTAQAQWQWIDKDGRKVYSDRSPPSDILEKNILKRPGGAKTIAVQPSSVEPTSAPGATSPANTNRAGAASAPMAKNAASAPVLTGVDKQLEARKKQAEDEAAAAKKVEAEKVAAARAENCGRAKRGVAGLDSGVRMATTNAKGEREIMDDKARAAETKRLKEVMASDCQP